MQPKKKSKYQCLILIAVFFICSCGEKHSRSVIGSVFFDSVLAKADKLYDSGDKKEALNMLISIHSQSPNLTLADEMNYFTWCGETYRKDLNDNDRYNLYADSIILFLEINNQVKNLPNRYIQALNMKADAYFAKGLYKESYDYYFRARHMALEYSDSCSLSQFSYSLAMALYRQQRFLEAAEYFKEATAGIGHCPDKFIFFYRKQELLDNTGLCYYHTAIYDSARYYYTKTLSFIDANYLKYDKRESVYTSAKAVVYGNLADLYIVLKKNDTARELLKKSISINIMKGNANSDALTDQIKLAKLYETTGNSLELQALLENIKAELDTIPDKNAELSWNKLMWQTADLKKDYIDAYSYLKTYVLLNDSLTASDKSLIANDADERIKNLEKQYQIAALKKNSELARNYLIIAAIILLMTFVIIFLVLRNAKKSGENVKQLTHLNEQINDQKEKLEIALSESGKKDKEKSRTLRAAAHDILNPLAAISGLTDILISESEDFSAEHKEILNLIKEACNNSISLSRDILEAALANESVDLFKEWVSINRLLISSIDLLSNRAGEKKQQIFFMPSPENVEVFVNKEKIWRVLNNLIGNAIKFSYENSTIEININTLEDKVDIAIKDKGVGIPEKNKPFIFDMFTEAKTPGTNGEKPHGLGLSISEGIIKAHQGSIWFESEEGKGAIFHIVLPARKASIT